MVTGVVAFVLLCVTSHGRRVMVSRKSIVWRFDVCFCDNVYVVCVHVFFVCAYMYIPERVHVRVSRCQWNYIRACVRVRN